MYARVTSFRGKPDTLDEMEAMLDANTAKIQNISGMISSYVVWNDDGTGLVATIYESEAAANSAVPAVQEIWGGMANFLAGPPEVAAFQKVHKMR
jgi:quinol monooxygenase YgiN